MKLRNRSVTASIVALSAALALPTTAQELPPRDDSRYQYGLTLDAVIDCMLIQNTLTQLKEESDPEWYRRHFAMTLTWQALAEKLNGGPVSQEAIDARVKALEAFEVPGLDDLSELAFAARPCEIIRHIHEDYYDALADIEDVNPALFADFAAKKNQTGADEYPDLPAKQINFGDWTYESRGNGCIATHMFEDGAMLRLGFTNFFDGGLTFEWDELPPIDIDADDYAAQFEPHNAGATTDEETYADIYAEGVNYDNYPGTALFIDEQVIGGMNPASGRSQGTRYVFGETIQRPYYNAFPAGKELTIKVLGKETHRVSIDNPALWNEMSNCMAQYPFG